MKVAKAKGRLRGKSPLNHRQEARVVALLNGGEYSTAELADACAGRRYCRSRYSALIKAVAP